MISPRQQRVFNFIRGYIESNGMAPTIDEIRRRFQYRAGSTVHRIVSILVAEGMIRRTPLIARGLEIVSETSEARRAA